MLDLSNPLRAGIVLMCLRDQRRRYDKAIARLEARFGADVDLERIANLEAKRLLVVGMIQEIRHAH